MPEVMRPTPGIEAGQDRHEHGGAEHGHEVLERQRNRPQSGRFSSV